MQPNAEKRRVLFKGFQLETSSLLQQLFLVQSNLCITYKLINEVPSGLIILNSTSPGMLYAILDEVLEKRAVWDIANSHGLARVYSIDRVRAVR